MELDGDVGTGSWRGVLGEAEPLMSLSWGENVGVSLANCARIWSSFGFGNGIGNGETETAVMLAECAW
jgi:hypothetical protein